MRNRAIGATPGRGIPASSFPVCTITVVAITALITGLQFAVPDVLPALERSPAGLREHQWWRLLTPLLVHSDGWRQIAFNFPAILFVGTYAERIFGARWWLALYFTAGIVGEIAGYLWQPIGAGASVAGAGLLGGVAMWALANARPQLRAGALVVLTGACVLTAMRDIHGPPILVGAGIALVFESRRVSTQSS